MPEDATTETTATTDATTTQTEGAAGAATTQQGAAATERTFSQAEVDRIVTDRLARARGEQRGKSETTTRQPDRKVTPDDRLDKIETEGAFYRGLARIDVKLSEDQESDLLDLFRIHKPERPGEWLAERAARFGLARKDTTTQTAASSTTTSATDTATKAAAAAATTTVPNRVNLVDTGALIDVSKLTDAERLQLGPAGIRQRLEQVVAAGQSRDGRPPVPAVLRPTKR